ncbi:MAG TPA: glycoside hydrolase family 6 protein [Anaerolineales bacterium]|nr:glycoside hydrolase family 6 protein [Anaerolineales bacterium]
MTNARKVGHILAVGVLLLALLVSASVPAASAKTGREHGKPQPPTRFYVPKPNHGALEQIADLLRHHNKADAKLIGRMIATPQAVWFTAGTPAEVRKDVKKTVKLAAAQHAVPVLVAYNIPFRDCAQFSAGGATTVAEYEAWIDAFAAGIGKARAVVILEPDGLGIIPWYTNLDGSLEWCQPAEADAETAAADRFAMMNYAVDALKAKPNVSVYLDGTHSGWLNVGDVSNRLVQAGVERANGFFLNVSNYQYSANQVQYGTWISSCIAYATAVAPGDFAGCPNQYWNGGPLPAHIAQVWGEWNGVAMDKFGEWSDTAAEQALDSSGVNQRYANMLGSTVPTAHFVIDSSRNGQGPWNPTTSYPDPQDWCNPPDRGLGLRPTADTSVELLDAYLWVKIPGESDGECTRGLGPGGETVDPEWGLIDPAAGTWFPEMALDLVHNANPPLP